MTSATGVVFDSPVQEAIRFVVLDWTVMNIEYGLDEIGPYAWITYAGEFPGLSNFAEISRGHPLSRQSRLRVAAPLKLSFGIRINDMICETERLGRSILHEPFSNCVRKFKR